VLLVHLLEIWNGIMTSMNGWRRKVRGMRGDTYNLTLEDYIIGIFRLPLTIKK